MTLLSALLLIAFSAAAFAYADTIRVALGGNARFVMLRGALFGLALSIFSGSAYFAGKPFLLAGISALAAYPGGGFCSADYLENSSASGFRRFLPAIAEGSLTGGIFCGMISFYISSAAGKFNIMQILMLFALAPVFALSAYVFDRFYNTEKKDILNRKIIIPLIGVAASLIIFSCFSGDTLMISATLAGTVLFAAASCGSLTLITLFRRLRFSAQNGGVLHESVSGILTGIASALTFIVCSAPLSSRFMELDTAGFSQIGLHPVAGIIATFVLALFALDQVQYFILPKWSQNPILSKALNLLKQYEFLLYCVLPFAIACMGNALMPEIIATVIISVFAWQLLCRRVFLKYPDHYIYIVIVFIPILGMLFVRLSTDWVLTPGYLILLYTVLYEACFLYLDYKEKGIDHLKRKGLALHITCTLLSALLIAGTIFLPKVI